MIGRLNDGLVASDISHGRKRIEHLGPADSRHAVHGNGRAFLPHETVDELLSHSSNQKSTIIDNHLILARVNKAHQNSLRCQQRQFFGDYRRSDLCDDVRLKDGRSIGDLSSGSFIIDIEKAGFHAGVLFDDNGKSLLG